MNKFGYKLGLLLSGLLILAAGLSPAFAQDNDKKVVKKEVKVMVDDDGNVTVNGKPVKDGDIELPDGTRMIVDEEGGRVMIIEEDDGDGRKKIIRRRMHAPDGDDKEANVFIRRMGDAPHEVMEWHSEGDMMDHARQMRFQSMAPLFIDEDFKFDFDFDHANPEIMKMEAETRQIARKLSKADGAEKKEMEQKLSQRLGDIFDKKLEVRQKRIEKLEQRLQKETTDLNERRSARKQIIDRRKAELLDDDKLEW